MTTIWTRRDCISVALAAGVTPLVPAGAARAETAPPFAPRELPAGPSPLDNPLKGWAAYAEDWARHHRPVAMAYLYVSWRELEPAPGRFAFEEWERRAWEHPLARGKHVIFRVVLDYPGKPTGVPQWLADRGVALVPYRDAGGEKRGDESAGRSPDYADPRLIEGLERLIAALGARYDRHPRVAFVALGLLGHWGEWHTYPREDLAPPPATRWRVLAAYRAAFTEKKLLARYPRDEAGAADWLGYHDDAFPDATGGAEAWHFLNGMRTAGRDNAWQRNPIGAEMVPNAAARLLGPEYGKTFGALLRARISWMGPYNPALEAGLDAVRIRRAEALVRRMGYDFRLQRVWLPDSVPAGGRFAFAADLVNQGLAPFYYPWRVELALFADDGREAARFPIAADPRQWLPGGARVAADAAIALRRGVYRVGLGIIDPWRGRPAIGFANALPRKAGWTMIGSVSVV